MKIRIQGDSVRFRLSKSEVSDLVQTGRIADETHFGSSVFRYEIVSATNKSTMSADFADSCITLFAPVHLLENWDNDNRVGFSENLETSENSTLKLILEKDFKCLDNGDEDQSDFYDNPKLNC